MDTNKKSITDVQWYMLDKNRFYFYSTISSGCSSAIQYPTVLIATRLQVQGVKEKLYKGTFDAFKCITKEEGVRGLYRGAYIATSFYCMSAILGWTSYELVRTELSNQGIHNNAIKSLIGGACSAFVSGLAIIPGEIISQHLMLIGLVGNERSKMFVNNPLNVNINQSKLKIALELIQNLYLKDGLRGFYRGLGASLASKMPATSLGWFFFDRYTRIGQAVLPAVVPYSVIELLATMTAAVTSVIILNPMEVLRTQIQVKRQPLIQIVRSLYEKEGLSATLKGVTARMIRAPIGGLFLMFSHVSVKKLSIKEEYQDKITW